MTTEETIRNKLNESLSPAHLEVINESHRHNVAPGSETHFKVIVISEHFEGKSLLARHRAINTTLADELRSGVHALSLHTKTPAEWSSQGGGVGASPPCLGGGK